MSDELVTAPPTVELTSGEYVGSGIILTDGKHDGWWFEEGDDTYAAVVYSRKREFFAGTRDILAAAIEQAFLSLLH